MRWCTSILCLFLLVGCDNKLASEAVKKAEIAFENNSYQEAVGLLKLASDESSNKDYEILHQQGELFLKMVGYDCFNQFDELLLAWTDLNLVDSAPSFVKEVAIQYIEAQLNQIKEATLLAIENGEASQKLLDVIYLIDTRLGSLNVFTETVEELVELSHQMEG